MFLGALCNLLDQACAFLIPMSRCLSCRASVTWVMSVLVVKRRSPACVTLVLQTSLMSSVNPSAPHTYLPLAVLVCISCFTARLLQSSAIPAGCHVGGAARLRRASVMVHGCSCSSIFGGATEWAWDRISLLRLWSLGKARFWAGCLLF